jgi:hypothetical protein
MGSGMLRVACNGFKKAGHEGSKLDSRHSTPFVNFAPFAVRNIV